jgi:hypothetical protein
LTLASATDASGPVGSLSGHNSECMNQRQVYRERWGTFAAWHYTFFQQLRGRLGIRVNGIYARPLVLPKGPPPSLPGFEFRVFKEGDALGLLERAKRSELGLSEAFVRKAFGKGDVCDAILYEGEIVSFVWAAFSPTHDSQGVYVDFDKKDRYGYFAFTLPEFRGRHLQRLFRLYGDGYAIARGCTHAIAFIAVDNRSSISSAEAAGNRRIGFAGYLKRGRLFVPFRTPSVRRRGFRFFVPAESA